MPEAMTPDTEQLMNDYLALRNGDLSKLGVLADTFTFYHPFGEWHGPDGLVEAQRESESSLTDPHLEVHDVLVGDDVAMWEWTLSGTHEGEWQGIPATGRTISFTGMSKTVMADGKVQENHAYFDSRDLLDQLGVSE